MRALPALVVTAIVIAVAVFFGDRPGSVSVLWEGWAIDTSVGVLVFAAFIFALVVAFLIWLLRAVLGGPRAFMRRRRERRRRAGYRALTQGMVAVAAGDADEAQRQARRADVLLAEPPLTLLLSAQAAQLNGDEDAARKYFTAMLERKETEFLGLRGLLMQAMRAGDDTTAIRLAERARALRPKTPWVLSNLFELQARRGDWAGAQQTLGDAVKRRALPAAPSRRHQAALLYERSREAEAEGKAREALTHAEKAHGLEPSFAPAARQAAALQRRADKPRQAAKTIETTWRVAPHPALAEIYSTVYPGEPPLSRLKRIERLASINPGHRESHLALAEAALAAQLWGAARNHLEAAGAQPGIAANGEDRPGPTARVCRLMAELETREHGDDAAAREWLARAATATPDPVYVCSACGTESAEWVAHCPGCRAFDTLDWRTPARAVPVLAAAAPVEALPAPAEAAGSKPGQSAAAPAPAK